MKKHVVVFDGTSAYVIPCSDLAEEQKLNNVEVMYESDDLDEAEAYATDANEEAQFGN